MIMVELAAIYKTELIPSTIEAYYNVLSLYSEEDVRAGIEIMNHEYLDLRFPVPGMFRSYVSRAHRDRIAGLDRIPEQTNMTPEEAKRAEYAMRYSRILRERGTPTKWDDAEYSNLLLEWEAQRATDLVGDENIGGESVKLNKERGDDVH